MRIEQALEKYILQLRGNGRSDHTIGQVRRHVRLFETWLDGEDDLAGSRTLMASASKASNAPYERISQKSAILATARCLTVLLLEAEPTRARHTLAALLNRISARLDPKPRHRACPRRSFKPRARWGPQGSVRPESRKTELR
jgi:hypothetical protein